MNIDFTAYTMPLLAAAVISAIVATYAWTRRSTNGALALLLMSVSITVWTIGYSLEIAGTSLNEKYAWGVIQYFGIALAPYGWLLFAISYNDLTKILSRRFFLLTASIPAITILLAFTTKWHGLIWSEYHINQQGDFSALGVSYGTWFWVHFAYSYIILLIGTILLLRALFRKQGMYRGQIISLLIAVLAPWVGNVLYLTGNSPIQHLDLTPFAFTVTIAALAWAIFGFNLVNITPLARESVIDSMRDGMIVLDVRGNVVDINNSASLMIGIPAAQVIGQAAGDVLSPWPHLVEKFRNVMEATDEIVVGEGSSQRRYEIRLTPLYDRQSQVIGRIIMLRLLNADLPLETKSTTKDSTRQTTPSLTPQPRPASQGRFYAWLIDFILTPVRTDIEIPKDINPNWYQARERSFTIIIKISALIGTLAYFFTLPLVRNTTLTNVNVTYGAVIALLWFLGIGRRVKFTYRAAAFLFLIYMLGLVETLNFGYSVESFIFFTTVIVTSVLLTGRTGGWIAAGFSIATLGILGFLISNGNFVPFNVSIERITPNNLEKGVTSLFVFSASIAAISASITILMESLNKAWQTESQASNLLQQERDLLEQRVEERTHELQGAESKYRVLVEQLPVMLYRDAVDEAGTNNYVSPQAERLFGYPVSDWTQDGNFWRDILHPEDREQAIATIEKTLKNGQSASEYRIITRGGRAVWVRDEAVLVNDDAGNPQFVQGILQDITSVKLAEEQIRKLSRAVEQSGNSIIVTDTKGDIEYVNPKFEEVTGYSFEEVKGKNPRILKSSKQRPEFYEKLWNTITKGEVWRGVFSNKRKDGSLYWESATIAPVLDHNGVITNYVAIKEDITARRQTEEQLRKLSQAVEQSGNTILIMDKNGIIEYVNPKFTEVTGYTIADAIGKSTSVLMTGDEAKLNYREDDWWKTVSAGRIWHGEFHNRRKDGSLFWESATIAPVYDQAGAITNYVEVKQDITEEKILQDQLQKQNDYLSVLHQITLDLLNRRDLTSLLQAIVDRSAILLDAPYSELMLIDGDALVVQAFTENQPSVKGERVTREQAKLSWQAYDTQQPVVLDDYAEWSGRRDIYAQYAIHAVADFPILAGDRCLGILALGRSQPNHPFTAEQTETGILFARLAALVLDNANLYESVMREMAESKRMEDILFNQNQYLSTVHKIVYELLKTRDFSSMLNDVVTHVADLAGAPHGYIYLAEGDDLVLKAATSNFASNIGNREKKPGTGILGQVWQTLQPLIIDDYTEWEGRDPSYTEWNLHAMVGIPIKGRDGHPLGVLEVARTGDDLRKFTAQEIDALTQFAPLASLVMDNANLYESAMQEISERKRAEAQNEAFLKDIKALQEIHLELSETENLKDLYTKMIGLAQNRLGLERIGLFVIDETTNELQGTFGIDQDGQVRDESYYREPISEDHWTKEIVNAHNHTKLWDNAPIFDDGRIMGHGWKTASALWNGHKALGYIVADCFITHRPARPYEAELTSLLGSTFGHLIEIKNNEISLQENELRFRQIVENASDIIYRTDIDGNFVYFNPTAVSILGYQNASEMLGKNYLDMAIPEWRHKLKRHYVRQLIAKENNTYFEFPAINYNGETVWLGQSVQVIKEDDEVIGFQAVARDITQLKQTQEALALSRDQALDASRMKSQLLSRVSHELRTPLGGILGYSELMQENAFGPLNEKQNNALRQIVESTRFLTKTVNDLLDEAQIEAKSLSLNNENFSLSELLGRVNATMSVLAGKKNLTFHTEISPELPDKLYGDPHRLQQILVNLAGNAIKFTKAGEIRVSLKRPAASQWSIEVSDTGAGIPSTEFETIFEPFRQVNNSITRENRGSGLGLAITKQLIDLMGGQITVQSEIGKGTTFTVTLPITNTSGE